MENIDSTTILALIHKVAESIVLKKERLIGVFVEKEQNHYVAVFLTDDDPCRMDTLIPTMLQIEETDLIVKTRIQKSILIEPFKRFQ